jgi:hypothetical protein
MPWFLQMQGKQNRQESVFQMKTWGVSWCESLTLRKQKRAQAWALSQEQLFLFWEKLNDGKGRKL